LHYQSLKNSLVENAGSNYSVTSSILPPKTYLWNWYD